LSPNGVAAQLPIGNRLSNRNLIGLGEGSRIRIRAKFENSRQIQKTISLAATHQFRIAAPLPLSGVSDDTCSHHIQIYVLHAVPEVLSTFDHGAVKAIAPEGAAANLALVISGGKLPLESLHEPADRFKPGGGCQQMSVIRSDGVIQQ
jgi:hypothetical protein